MEARQRATKASSWPLATRAVTRASTSSATTCVKQEGKHCSETGEQKRVLDLTNVVVVPVSKRNLGSLRERKTTSEFAFVSLTASSMVGR